MTLADAGSTHPSLLRSITDWDDDAAWFKFQARYDNHLKRCCAMFHLDANAAEEICQNTWIQVANRIRSFVYDPKKSFRGWLWNVCRFEVLRYLDARRKDSFLPLEERDEWAASRRTTDDSDFDSESIEDALLAGNAKLRELHRRAEEVHARVRQRVKPHTWEAFRLVSVCLWTPRETAQALGISQALVHKANQRVLQMLRDEEREMRGEMSTLK